MERIPFDNAGDNFIAGIFGYFRQWATRLAPLSFLGLGVALFVGYMKYQIPVYGEITLWMQMLLLWFVLPAIALFIKGQGIHEYFSAKFYGRIGMVITQYFLVWLALNVLMLMSLSWLDILVLALLSDMVFSILSILVYNVRLGEVSR